MVKLRNKINTKGYSLPELVVAMGIFAILAAMTLYNYPEFSRFMSLKKEISKIVSNIRLSQVYSLGTKQHGTLNSNQVQGYGVNFNKNFPKKYYIFADVDDISFNFNEIYDGGTELSKELDISDNEISDLECDDVSKESINILYKRPYIDVILKDGLSTECSKVDIIMQSSLSSNIKRTITIQKSGGVISVN